MDEQTQTALPTRMGSAPVTNWQISLALLLGSLTRLVDACTELVRAEAKSGAGH